MAVTAQLPLDWAVLPSLVLLVYFALLPRAELSVLMAFGPLVALAIGCAGTIRYVRARPAITLLLFVGAGLRLYGLGWGAGYVFHPEEQALVAGEAEGIFAGIVYVTTAIWSQVASTSPWAVVIVGRICSALLGVLLIALVYALGCQLLRRRWALLAAAFVAVAPILIQQSHLGVGTQAVTILVALVMLCSTMLLDRADVRLVLLCLIISGLLTVRSPASVVWLTAPLVAMVMIRQQVRYGLLQAMPLVALVLLGVSRWANEAIAASTVAAGNAAQHIGTPSYIYPLFNILLWAIGPLLMQLGLVGWAVACVSAIFGDRRVGLDQRWFPLLWSTLIAFAVAGKGPNYSLEALMPFVPVLSLTGALLLQMFSQRLRFVFGRRTVRLLAGTAFTLAFATSLGLLNMYRKPDQRLVASRWLVANLNRDSMLLMDPTISEPLPLSVMSAYRTATLGGTGNHDDALKQYAAKLSQATHIATMATRLDTGISNLRRGDPLLACAYVALFDGRLGFVERAAFTAQPHIGSWTIDNRRADQLIRGYDHSDIHIYERVVPLSAAAVEQALRCSYTM